MSGSFPLLAWLKKVWWRQAQHTDGMHAFANALIEKAITATIGTIESHGDGDMPTSMKTLTGDNTDTIKSVKAATTRDVRESQTLLLETACISS